MQRRLFWSDSCPSQDDNLAIGITTGTFPPRVFVSRIVIFEEEATAARRKAEVCIQQPARLGSRPLRFLPDQGLQFEHDPRAVLHGHIPPRRERFLGRGNGRLHLQTTARKRAPRLAGMSEQQHGVGTWPREARRHAIRSDEPTLPNTAVQGERRCVGK